MWCVTRVGTKEFFLFHVGRAAMVKSECPTRSVRSILLDSL